MLTTDAFVALMAVLAASPVLASAAYTEPQHEHEHGKHMAKRNGPGMYICTGSNGTGNCYWEEAAVGYCQNYWLSPSTSFGPDKGLSCIVHPESDCKGDKFLTQYPGNTELYFTGMSWICKNA